jgi:diguanylate cyclase (GGDEF)-like protein/PAS domain S-box-containing protein
MTNRVLIITSEATVAKDLQDALTKTVAPCYSVLRAKSLAEAIDRLRNGGTDVILADLMLRDSSGIATFDQLSTAAPHTPIILLSTADDEMLTTEAVQRGAQGYLSKGHFNSYLVPQTLRTCLQRNLIEEQFFLEKTRAEITLNSISDAVIGTDMAGKVTYLNIAAEKITGWNRDEANGHPIAEVMSLINSETRRVESNPLETVLQDDKPMHLKVGTILIRRDGEEVVIEDSAAPIHDWEGKITGGVIVFHDVTAAHAMNLKMAYLAKHDFLTGLPNRVLLNDRITQAIALAKRRRGNLAVLFLDLDNFKFINDSLGHAVGDALLKSVAKGLSTCIRSSDTVSRQGGDEFVILVTENRQAENAAITAEKILSKLAEPHVIAEHHLHVTASIGISLYPVDGDNAETLIKNADNAMYCAKGKGRNNYQYFKNAMNLQAVERQLVEVNLRLAVERREFSLYYQPKVNLLTNMITGAEALIRWIHPDWGLVLPDRFVAIAEDCGQIVPIGRWVLQQVCRQIESWSAAGLRPIPISVNISALEFRHLNFIDELRTILDQTGIPPAMLQLEITESVLMNDTRISIAKLEQLKTMGVLLAVDDFGTGYSSLGYLKQFPVDVLKIDRSFLQNLGGAEDNGIIVGAVIAMGNSLKLQVIAEGVENEDQLAFLKAQHCEEGQGFLFGMPMASEQFAAFLASGLSQPRVNAVLKKEFRKAIRRRQALFPTTRQKQ